jgi:CheY-like chemotaxis protein
MTTLRPILLVEDNPMDVDLTLRAFRLRKLGNVVEVARDGEEALTLLTDMVNQGRLPAVVLLDLKLPRLSGLEVLRHIKREPRLRAVPVVVLTSSREDSDVDSAYELGANSYIVKPVDFEKFMEVATQIDLYWCVLNVGTP